jgi:hypothetical protein
LIAVTSTKLREHGSPPPERGVPLAVVFDRGSALPAIEFAVERARQLGAAAHVLYLPILPLMWAAEPAFASNIIHDVKLTAYQIEQMTMEVAQRQQMPAHFYYQVPCSTQRVVGYAWRHAVTEVVLVERVSTKPLLRLRSWLAGSIPRALARHPNDWTLTVLPPAEHKAAEQTLDLHAKAKISST